MVEIELAEQRLDPADGVVQEAERLLAEALERAAIEPTSTAEPAVRRALAALVSTGLQRAAEPSAA
jgi:hypothetical protein